MPVDVSVAEATRLRDLNIVDVGGSRLFWLSKRVFDLVVSLALIPLLAMFMVIVAALNPRLNPGPLFFRQRRMGRDLKPFVAIKFRSMVPAETIDRGADDPIEADRIRPFGEFLRKSRIDELPQILNVLRGEMSLIGPRPDYFAHAVEYLRQIPEYRARHATRPGISGLAQVTLGYAVGIEATRAKAIADLTYICKAGFAMETRVFWLTIVTVALRRGA